MRKTLNFTIVLLLLVVNAVFAFPVTVKNVCGKPLILKHPPKRIVSLTPSNTEILFALGLGDRIVGVTSADNYPAAAKKKPKMGKDTLSVERILAAKPDLVIGVQSLQSGILIHLCKMGIPTISVDPKNISQTMDAIRFIGHVTGRDQKALQIVGQMKSKIIHVRKLADRYKQHPRIFVEIWNKPLMTAGPDTFVDEMVGIAGGQNIAHDARKGYVQISEEVVITRNPQIIILPSRNKAEVLKRTRWKHMDAVRNHQVVNFNPDILVRPGPRLADGLVQLEKIFHSAGKK